MKHISSTKNEIVKQWKKLLTKKGRLQTKRFLIEGEHLVEEAVRAGIIKELIVREDVQVPGSWKKNAADLITIDESVAKVLSETETTQGIFAVCEMKEQTERLERGRYLLLDRLQDPGNVGTMIRTADAAGFDGVIIGHGTVDVYNSKVLRATQGSIFHLPVIMMSLDEAIQDLHELGVFVLGTALRNANPYTEVENLGAIGLIIGNEAQGVAPELLDQCDGRAYIPIRGKAESLNAAVAAGILLYHFAPVD
ncbi:MAG: RNA methyltransferase [Exiguobacterium oxidotolerans]|uniref:TrmH family RNA methyltransferase n=1 Tax=Exiguobacterium TaxID=33986 RepID=UPI0004949E43|nr:MULTISPECIES: RNA methyltransferase [Exiguobacterium]ASI36032.1 RNA methyltransferase [Exiguobacterium sp. N4-1P]